MQLIYFKKLCKGQAGSALIGLIVTMVFLIALAGAMIAQTTTGSLGFVNENSSLRAYYLAESGFRYAAARLKDDGESALDTLLSHNPFSFGNKGSFSLEFKTYIFEFDNVDVANELVTKVSFGIAPSLPSSPGSGNLFYVKVGDTVEVVNSIVIQDSGGTQDPDGEYVKFTKDSGIWSGEKTKRVRLVVKSNGVAVSEGGKLHLLPSSPADLFPRYNGRFEAKGKTYQYKRRETDKLVGITRVDDTIWEAPLLSNGDPIVLQDFAKLTSTGTFGEGDMAVSREIVYNIPVSTSEKAEFHDTFEDKDNWEAVSTLGTHDIETIGDDSVLKVTGTDPVRDGDVASLIKLDSSDVDEMLKWSYDLAKKFLSYDTQVRAGFDPSVPSTYMAGISFRQDAEDSLGTSTGNSYGVSFLKGGSSDGIPDDLVPYNDCPMIVLWQQTNSGTDKKWLAYKHLIGRPIYLFDDMESGKSKWTEDPPWDHIITDFHSTTTCWTDSPAGDYAEDVDTSLETTAIDLSGASFPKLSFWHHYEIYPWFGFFGGRADIEVSTDGGFTWPTRLARYGGVQGEWKNEIIDLSAYAGQSDVRIRFRLRSDSLWLFDVGRDGWYIDDVIVAEDFSVNETTLMVRVKEAATLYFTGGGATPIEAGDIVYQATGRGTVLGTPILESGSWTVGGNATGIILLNKISGSFTKGQPLYVDGTSLAATAAGAGFYRPRDNYIKVYYGDKDGYGTPNNNPLDYDKHGNPRGELYWPSDEVEDWSAANDYFTLVQWDKVEDVAVSSLDKISSLDEPDAILRTNELTTSTGTFTDTEIGLHTFGNNSTSVYFDDFGLQTDVPTSEGFFPAIQQ